MKPSVGIVNFAEWARSWQKPKGYAIVGGSSLHSSFAQRLAGICRCFRGNRLTVGDYPQCRCVLLTKPDGVIEFVCGL